jgi:signal transduction histidine kinase
VFDVGQCVRPLILCWPAELNQVFMNVLMNAVHAIDDARRDRPGVIRIGSVLDGEAMKIVITDDGTGMTQDVLLRACDPFFTTRPVGSGSGLGLSISRDIIAKHGGELRLQSAPGEGTQVVITLPLHA